MKEENTIYVDVLSSYSIRPLADLIKDAYSEQVPFFECSIGKYLKSWHQAKEGDTVIYCIDQIAVCSGSITFIKKKVFRPLWVPDNQIYSVFVDFVRIMCNKSFDRGWQNRMIRQHSVAIKQKKWLFATFAVMQPSLTYSHNKEILMEKAKMMEEADNKVDGFVMCPMSD